MRAPDGDDWVGLSADPLPVGAVTEWVGRPDCGAVVLFCGTARDHADGRTGRRRARVRGLRGAGRCPRLGPSSPRSGPAGARPGGSRSSTAPAPSPSATPPVVVAVSTPHRAEAFAAARFAIDAVKASVPIWKQERWDGGDDWGLEGNDLLDPAEVRVADVGAVAFLLVAVLALGRSARPSSCCGSASPPACTTASTRSDARWTPSPRPNSATGGRAAIGGWPATSPSTSARPTRSSTRGAGASCSTSPRSSPSTASTNDVLAMGHEAWQMIGRTPGYIVAVRPLRKGAITDFDITQRMIRLLLQRVGVNRFNRPRVVICVPSAITEVERRAVTRGGPPGGRRRGAAHRAAHGRRHRRRAARSTSPSATWSSTSAVAPRRRR